MQNAFYVGVMNVHIFYVYILYGHAETENRMIHTYVVNMYRYSGVQSPHDCIVCIHRIYCTPVQVYSHLVCIHTTSYILCIHTTSYILCIHAIQTCRVYILHLCIHTISMYTYYIDVYILHLCIHTTSMYTYYIYVYILYLCIHTTSYILCIHVI